MAQTRSHPRAAHGNSRIRRSATYAYAHQVERRSPQPVGLFCASCGDVVGVYERIWVERPNGTLSATSLLNLDDEEREAAVRVWHAQCHLAAPG
jgi:hypothetical protein